MSARHAWRIEEVPRTWWSYRPLAPRMTVVCPCGWTKPARTRPDALLAGIRHEHRAWTIEHG